jgi:hypothetical protein
VCRALRSGKYEQGGGNLRADDRAGSLFCCLGVAADVLDPSGWMGRKKDRGPRAHRHGGSIYPVNNATKTGYLERGWALRVLGFVDEVQKDLAHANDSCETFEQIAKRIEALALPAKKT